ncbi:MAG: hypothetical protein AAB490_01700 [Patescibacteria group bacterium]
MMKAKSLRLQRSSDDPRAGSMSKRLALILLIVALVATVRIPVALALL